MNKKSFWLSLMIAVFMMPALAANAGDKIDRLAQRGQYLVSISGCNDCHTPDYPQTAGKIPKEDWLTGSPVGFAGPWGTTYPANLRNLMQSLTEALWLAKARTPLRPPMPWFSLRDMSDDDLRAIYAFIRSLGPKGGAAPAYVPPGQAVLTPYIEFVPKNLPQRQANN